ncbi:MAG TPA: ERCC4 domain-containing protein [Candidatus Nanoarchaeia archaeon]|nr:ERCC4 domain-containing protein [Candidatus Nanoarchaeia archaeon]
MAFYDIFSKKSESLKAKQKIKIIIDNREKNSLVPACLVKLGAEIEFNHLEIGDYITRGTIIERKTISDLKSSIINKRIIEQIKQLKLQNAPSLLLIEGIAEHDIYEGGIHENALRGFLLSAALEYQMPLIFTQNAEDTAKYLYVLAKRQEKTQPISILTKRKPESVEEQKQFILESFQGIGPSTALKLTKEFKSLNKIFNASKSKLEKILGKKTDKFKKILD